MEEKVEFPVKVYNDNQAAIKVASNNGSVKRTKHIETKFFHVQDLVEKNMLKLIYRETSEMEADPLTKATGAKKLELMRQKLMVNWMKEEGVVKDSLSSSNRQD